MTNSEYPENREWKQKAFGMPKLPSGDMGQDKVLYYILKMVKDGKSANTMFNIEGSKIVKMMLEDEKVVIECNCIGDFLIKSYQKFSEYMGIFWFGVDSF